MTLRLCYIGLLFSVLAGCGHKPEPVAIVVGHVAPLSGTDKARGEHARQGIALAVQEANAEGHRILDRQVGVDHADTRSDPAAVRSVVKRLLSVNRVSAILGGPETAGMDNVGSVAQSSGVPFVLEGGQPAQPTAEYVFYTGLTPAAQGRALGRFAKEELKKTRVAIVQAGKHDALLAAFTREVPKNDIVALWSYTSNDKLPAFADVIAKKPEAILFLGKAETLADWVQHPAAESVPVLFCGEEGSLAILQATAIRATVYLTTAFAVDDSLPALKEFVDMYQQRYSETPDAAAGLAYDDARLLFEAMRQAKSMEGSKVCTALSELRFESLTGPLSFDKQHAARRTVFIVKLSAGQTQLSKRYAADEQP